MTIEQARRGDEADLVERFVDERFRVAEVGHDRLPGVGEVYAADCVLAAGLGDVTLRLRKRQLPVARDAGTSTCLRGSLSRSSVDPHSCLTASFAPSSGSLTC
jgi:hypothetical protein